MPGTRDIRGPIQYDNVALVLTGNHTVVNAAVVVVNKTVGAATAVTLPASRAVSTGSVREVIVIDGKGDAASNNITVTAAGTDTINGASTYVMTGNYQVALLHDIGGGVWVAK